MKSIFYIFALVITSGIHAQSNYVSTFLDNPNYYALQLHKLPWDETRLYQVTADYSSGYSVYTIDDVSFGTITPVQIPLISEMRGEPTILDDGMLFSAFTTSGIELVYFDDVNSTIFDLNLGSVDSEPVIYEMGGRVLILAFDGVFKQLYEFDKVTHLVSKITNDMISVESICATWGNDIFYRTKFFNATTGENEFNLIKAFSNGSSYSFATIQSISIPTLPNRSINWDSPIEKWGSLYLSVTNFHASNFSQNSAIGIISIDLNDQVSTVNLTLPTNAGEFVLIDWNGLLCAYSEVHDMFYTSSDGSSFIAESTPVNGRIVEHYISENEELYFRYIQDNGINEIVEYDGSFQTKYLGKHLHFVLEDNGIMYFSDYKDSDSSSIVLVYNGMNTVDEVNVIVGSHPPVPKSAVIHNGIFTFLFSNGGVIDDHDIYQLTGAPSAGVDEISSKFSVYPNPLSAGESLLLQTNIEGNGVILTTDGKIVKQLELSPGANVIETSSLSSGVYFVSYKNHAQSIVVN